MNEGPPENNVAVWKWITGVVLTIAGTVIIALSIIVMNKLNQIDSLATSVVEIKADVKIMEADIKMIETAAAELKGRFDRPHR